VITLTVYEGAYIAEIVRGGIESVDHGQWEAAASLGFPNRGQLQFVIMPQAFKVIVPPLAGQFISIIKDSAIVSVISVSELTFQGLELMAATGLTFEVWITITVLYFLLTVSCAFVSGYIERKISWMS
jgi:polar amino acid transport system permease protein